MPRVLSPNNVFGVHLKGAVIGDREDLLCGIV